MENLLKLLKDGKNVYVGYCLNADVDGIPMIFENDKEAIRTLSNYEAEIYKLYIEKDNISKKLLYDPYDCFN